ncbi:MAG: DDE-type integrase/transposase/recombinase [Bacteroidota bacterium]
MGRPSQAVLLPTFDPAVIACLESLRPPGTKIGPKSIYAELCQNKRLAGYAIPKPSTIAYFLKQSGRVSNYEKHYPLPNIERQEATQAHQVWQLDGQGALKAPGVGRVNFLNVKDLHSSVYCGSYVAPSRSHNGSPSAHDYRNALRRAFVEFGLPCKVQVDHASAFYENKGKSPFPTRFHLWLISLGIELVFSRKYRPTDQAVVERMHQTIENQVIGTQAFTSLAALQQRTDERRKLLNYQIPSVSTANKPPLKAHPQARHSGRFYCPKNEAASIDFDRVHRYLANGTWIRKATATSGKGISLGGKKYYLADADKYKKVEFTFDDKTAMLQPCMYDTRRQLKPIPIKGLNYEYLQGQDFIDNLPQGFQFQLPFPNTYLSRGTTFLDITGV